MYVKTRESAYIHTKRTHARTHMYVPSSSATAFSISLLLLWLMMLTFTTDFCIGHRKNQRSVSKTGFSPERKFHAAHRGSMAERDQFGALPSW